jgi:hypothetical protein
MAMNNENAGNNLRATSPSVLEVLRAARLELDTLIQQRGEITRRIGTARQAIIGLANLVGGAALHEAALELMDLRPTHRQSGFTRACRYLLTASNRPLNSPEICDELRQKFPEIAARHKDLQASATTVMNRLIAYGEATPCKDSAGRRAWTWVAADDPLRPETISPSDQGHVLFAENPPPSGLDAL